MSDTADDVVRREVSKLLRVEYRGKFMCASCLLKFAVERFGTTLYTRGQIEPTRVERGAVLSRISRRLVAADAPEVWG